MGLRSYVEEGNFLVGDNDFGRAISYFRESDLL